jgi:preprotein translocase SecE subunit
MAKGKKKSKKRKQRVPARVDAPGTSIAEDPASMELIDEAGPEAEIDQADEGDDGQPDDAVSRARKGPPRGSARPTRIGGMSIYKPGQGYYTRVGTAVGAAVLIAGLWNMLYRELGVFVDPDQPWTFYLQIGVPSVVAVLLGLLVYWVVGRGRRTGDFMILTEGEMKKVNWSSRKEVIGSTKVVIFVVFAMAILLFCVDLVFAWFFNRIGVLEGGPFGS